MSTLERTTSWRKAVADKVDDEFGSAEDTYREAVLDAVRKVVIDGHQTNRQTPADTDVHE